jgi:hypothetical protein
MATVARTKTAVINGVTKRAIPFLLILLICHIPLNAQSELAQWDLPKWFREEKAARRYLEYREDILAVFAEVRKQQLPRWILLEKLNEGVSKKVKGDKLVAALEQGIRDLAGIRDIFSELELVWSSTELYEETMKTLYLYLSGGLSLPLLDKLLRLSLEKEQENAERLLLCETILRVRQATKLQETQLYQLAESLANSTLQATGYLSVSSFFVKGKIRHMQEEYLLELVTGTLDNGGGLIQLNEQFNRRTRKQ